MTEDISASNPERHWQSQCHPAEGHHEKECRKLLELNETGKNKSFTTRILQLIHEVEISGGFGGAEVAANVKLQKQKSKPENQLKILETLNNVARRLGESVKHQYYILIDDLDRNWQNTEAQNAFIAALFSSLRTFNRPPNIKCVVAVREKIYRALPLQDRDKLHDSIIEVRWNADAVREMINARVTFKFNAPANEIWGKMFPSDAFQEIWKHSMGRPRKAIRLTTLLIEQAVHEAHLTAINEDLRAAICKFSDERLIDVTGELQYTYPSLERFLRRMTGWKKEFDYAELKKLLELVCLKIACAETNSETYKWILTYEPRPFEFAQLLVENGLLLFKPSRSAAAREYDSEQSFETTNDSWFAIHPMFGPALGLVGA